MMKFTRTLLLSVLVAAIAIVAACGNGNSSNSTQEEDGTGTIRLGLVGGGMTPMVVQIGLSDGSYEQAGITIEETSFTSGADMIQALVGGSLDVVLGSYEHVLRQRNNDLKVKAYGEIFNGVGYSLLVKSDAAYQTLEDLKGTTLAVTRVGSLSDTGLREGLKEVGLDPERDVTLINGGSGATMLAAIESDQAAGGMVSEPTISQMLDSGDYKVLYDPPFEYAGIVIMAKEEWAEKNQALLKNFLAVSNASHQNAKKDVSSAVDAMEKLFEQIPRNVMENAVKNQLAKVPEGLVLSEAGADFVHQTQIDAEVLQKPIPYEEAVDLSLLP